MPDYTPARSLVQAKPVSLVALVESAIPRIFTVAFSRASRYCVLTKKPNWIERKRKGAYDHGKHPKTREQLPARRVDGLRSQRQAAGGAAKNRPTARWSYPNAERKVARRAGDSFNNVLANSLAFEKHPEYLQQKNSPLWRCRQRGLCTGWYRTDISRTLCYETNLISRVLGGIDLVLAGA